MSRYRCVDAQKAAGFPVVAACRAAGVSASAFYAWAAQREQGQPAAEQAEAELVAKIRTIHRESSGTYGSPRVTHELRRRGWRVNHKRVERLMAAHGIVGHRPRRRRGLTKPDTAIPPAPDLLGRLFDPDQLDVRRANAHQHLSFGSGPHLCLGASLARLEGRVVLEELTAALPSLRLDADQALQFAPMIAFRGPRALHVSWD